MLRDENSHKGQNGVLGVIGGSANMHGAPLFSALSGESTGVDLLHLFVPRCHAEVSKQASHNFWVHPFTGNELLMQDAPAILRIIKDVDAVLIGPGLCKEQKTLEAIYTILDGYKGPVVIDATALQPTVIRSALRDNMILTPHSAELKRMNIDEKDLSALNCTVVLKGVTDVIFCNNKSEEVKGGNAGLTVGGTGDVLVGIIAGLLAQGINASKASKMASTIVKRAGALLYHQKGYAYTAEDVIKRIPHLLHSYTE